MLRCKATVSLLNLFILSCLFDLSVAIPEAEVVGDTAPDHIANTESADHLVAHQKRYGSGEPWWFSQIRRQGNVPYQPNSSYVIYRNVLDYGAKGDGITDDTDAINNATFDGRNCIYPCDSSTTNPAIVYFPPGTYMVSKPLVMTYYTQFVGDANDLPTLKAMPTFDGIAILDSNPYLAYGYNWYQNQNNFYRHIRNFILDITLVPTGRKQAYCIHWQVAQATSLQNIVFNMVEGGDDNTQWGIFMDNGSGGWLEDLIFNGGNISFYSGNQQFTCRNLTFNRCQTAIYQNWNWVFNYNGLIINDCNIGLDMSQGGAVIVTGSVVLQDTIMSNVNIGVLTTFATNSTPITAGTLILDNVNFDNTPIAVQYPNGTVILEGNRVVKSFVQGKAYTAYDAVTQVGNQSCYQPTANNARIQQEADGPPKPQSLLDANGNFYSRSRPQYEGVPITSLISSFDYGCIGDGVTDDTECIQDYFNSIKADQIAFVNHGAYVIRNTIQIPNNIKIIGEIWPLFMIDGTGGNPLWADKSNPVPAFRVGNPGESGSVELVELLFETIGPVPGAILTEWNLAQTTQGSNGMWDVHWRIGGSNGTQLQSSNCVKTPDVATTVDDECIASFLLTHITRTGQVFMSNNWGWVSDHELDLPDHQQINLYNGRGLLVESEGPVWLYGSSYEHSMLFNYGIANAKDVYMGIIQSETAYMQSNPNALTPFSPRTDWSDPDFSQCFLPTCYKTFGLHITNSTYVYIYGGGLYSFFDNYNSGCILTTNCQTNMVAIDKSEAIYIFALSTEASEDMFQVDGVDLVAASDNKNGFCQTVAVFEYP